MDDDVSIDELRAAVEHNCGGTATFLEAVEIHEHHAGKTVWQGAVKVFALAGHPTAQRAYAWSYRTEGTRRRFVTVLGLPPVTGPLEAVRAVVMAEYRRTRN